MKKFNKIPVYKEGVQVNSFDYDLDDETYRGFYVLYRGSKEMLENGRVGVEQGKLRMRLADIKGLLSYYSGKDRHKAYWWAVWKNVFKV